MKELLTVEWCENQGCFHLDSAAKTFAKNGLDYLKRKQGEWIVLGIFESREEAKTFIEALEAMREEAK